MRYLVVRPEAEAWVKSPEDAERYYLENGDRIYIPYMGKSSALSELPEMVRQRYVEWALRLYDERGWLAYTLADATRAEAEAKKRGTWWGAMRAGEPSNDK